MKALVTCGGGFLGRYIVEELLARGDQVRTLGRSRYPELERLGVEAVQGDIRDEASVIKACGGVEVVSHAAALPLLWGRFEELYAVHVDGTKNVLKGCRAQGVAKLVYTSTPSVVFDMADLCGVDETAPHPDRYICHYPATKSIAERLVLQHNREGGLLTAALRPHLIWGPGDRHLIPRVIARARARQLFIVGDGTNRVDITYVENAAWAHVLAADHLAPGSPVAGRAYFISQGEPVVLWDFINRLLQRLDVPPVTRAIPYRAAWALGGLSEIVFGALRLPGEPRMTRFLASQLARSHYFDIGRAKADFGYAPRVSTAEGLERLVRDLQERCRRL
jgi:2-alkyl-3-oxoalkanoate reductase